MGQRVGLAQGTMASSVSYKHNFLVLFFFVFFLKSFLDIQIPVCKNALEFVSLTKDI